MITGRISWGCESIQKVARRHDLYAQAVKTLIRFAANHTGVIECGWTYEGVTETWAHEAEPVADCGRPDRCSASATPPARLHV
jgi:hypothetical protein